MGDAVNSESYTPRQRTRYRQRLIDDLEVFDRHLQQAEFIDQGTIGLELELNLVDKNMQPKTCNGDVLAALDDEFQSEIGAYNVEMNHPPLSISGTGLQELEDGLNQRLNTVRMAANKADAEVAMIGTLPSVTTEFLEDPAWMTSENRYKALSNSVLESRGELVHIELEGQEKYRHGFEDIAPESTCTSIQLHLQVSPNHFAAAWNASQAIAGVQTALSANSPLFAGHKLWHESRVPVFQQSIDTRTPELVTQGVRPRVWFGERWITSAFDLFEENVRYFSPLLPEDRVESGTPIVTDGKPGLHYLNMQNGTIWRWNRPIYDPNTELSHIRVENRLLPAGPTVADIVADAALLRPGELPRRPDTTSVVTVVFRRRGEQLLRRGPRWHPRKHDLADTGNYPRRRIGDRSLVGASRAGLGATRGEPGIDSEASGDHRRARTEPTEWCDLAASSTRQRDRCP